MFSPSGGKYDFIENALYYTYNPFLKYYVTSKSIEKNTQDCDLLIVGHRKMSQFKSSLMDSVDEGIANLISCPVLVVQK